MYTVSKYVIKILFKYIFVSSLLIFLLLFLSASYGAIGSLAGYDYTIIEFLIFTTYAALIDINKMIPIIMSLSVMITILILMRNHELLAYMTLGGSIVKLSIPFIVVAIIVSCFMLVMEYTVVPSAKINKEVWRNIVKHIDTTNKTVGFSNTWFIEHNQKISNIGFVSIPDKKIYNIIEYNIENNRINKIIEIETIYKKNNEWIADNITINNIMTNPPQIIKKPYEIIKEGTEVWDKIASLTTTNIKELTPKELYLMIQISKSKGINSAVYEVNLYFKIASALSVIILVLLLFPISINFSRNYSIIKNATVTFAFALIFILAQNVGKSMGDVGVLSPITATFGPLILFLIISIIMIYMRSRAR